MLSGAPEPPLHHPHMSPSGLPMSSPYAPGLRSSPPNPNRGASKAVVRAACLSCRTAKRRCDGGQPVCGPCSSRGVTADSGGCTYVASKRGGPRFKGCTGEEAKKIKADKERRKLDQARKLSVGSVSGHHDFAEGHHLYSHASSGQADRSSVGSGRSTSLDEDTHMFHDFAVVNESLPTMQHRDRRMDPPSQSGSSPSSHAAAATSSWSGTSRPVVRMEASTVPSSISTPIHPNTRPSQPLSPYHVAYTQDVVDPVAISRANHTSEDGERNALSSANLEIWQKMQDVNGDGGAKMPERASLLEAIGLNDFYTRLEGLPKAGRVSDEDEEPVKVLPWDDSESNMLLDAADSEQQARYLLTSFFDKVYASAPVLLAPENLSSLAFWFSGKGPCALYAAIGALVTLRLPEHEAHRTLRGGYQNSPNGGEGAGMTRAEIAAHHARTSEFLLRRFSQQQAAAAAASFGLDPNALSSGCDPNESGRSLCQGPSDPELLRIEAAAAHTLLAHYHYGSGGHAAQRVAHDHALEAWNSLQGIRIDLQEGVPPKDPLTTSHFSWEQKQEWAKRVYWTSFAAASVTATTGGFKPISFTCNAVTALKLRPALETDVGAWGVFIRGAQHVARGYTALYDFEVLKGRTDLDQEEATREKARIFSEFSKLDRDMTAFSTYDPAWRSPTEGSTSQSASEQGLGFALRTAGKLMTAGATIIIHRGQAYANAHIFMDPQCGLPQAARLSPAEQERQAQLALSSAGTSQQNSRRPSVPYAGSTDVSMDMQISRPASPGENYLPPARLWHRSGSISLPPAGSGSPNEQITFCKPNSLDPHVAVLDANFIHDPIHSNGLDGNHHEAPTTTAMAAFQHFQAQQTAAAAQRDSGPNGGTSRSRFGGGASHARSTSDAASGPRGSSGSFTPGSGVTGNERYKYGPFEPEYSAEKCKWAADSMLESVPALLHGSPASDGLAHNVLGNTLQEAPSLPPWAACSYVLAGYALLMQCLIVQASRAWRHGDSNAADHPEALANGGAGDEMDEELARLRDQVMAIHDLLDRFALTFDIAKEYRKEVAVLLEVNKRLK